MFLYSYEIIVELLIRESVRCTPSSISPGRGVFAAGVAADAHHAALLVYTLSFSLSPCLSEFESQSAEAKWKVTLGRQHCMKHRGSLSEEHAGSF